MIELTLPSGHESLKSLKDFNDLCRILIQPIGDLILIIYVTKEDFDRLNDMWKDKPGFLNQDNSLKLVTAFGMVYINIQE